MKVNVMTSKYYNFMYDRRIIMHVPAPCWPNTTPRYTYMNNNLSFLSPLQKHVTCVHVSLCTLPI